MADTTVTIKQDGTGDYTTIASAIAASNVTSGYYKMVIDDSNSYNENVQLSPATGSPTSSNYMWLTVSDGNRHSGVAATSGHARIYQGGSSNALVFNSAYGRAEYLEINTTSTNGAQPASVRADNVLISRCIIKGNGNANSGMFVGGEALELCVDNCLITNNQRGVFTYTSSLGSSNRRFDHCTIVDNDTYAASGYGNISMSNPYGNSMTTHFYNLAFGLSGFTDIFVFTGYDSLITHSGSHNAWDTNTSYFQSSTGSYTSSQDISSGGVTTTTTTANAMIVTSLTSGSEDFTPVPATGAGSNLLLGNGVNRQGSEPDPRQDFSTDIRGAARPTSAGKIDIGAFQITTAAGFKYWDGSAWADSTAVQYWNGSAWTDVTAIQYWNGSAWTDPS